MARIMNFVIPCILLMQFFVPLVISEIEVCDVEGSGAGDCVDQCCDPSVCELKYNPEQNPDKRCCSEEERSRDLIPNDCTLCITCCDETERNKIPLPKHCSKCPKCGVPTTVAPKPNLPPSTKGE